MLHFYDDVERVIIDSGITLCILEIELLLWYDMYDSYDDDDDDDDDDCGDDCWNENLTTNVCAVE